MATKPIAFTFVTDDGGWNSTITTVKPGDQMIIMCFATSTDNAAVVTDLFHVKSDVSGEPDGVIVNALGTNTADGAIVVCWWSNPVAGTNVLSTSGGPGTNWSTAESTVFAISGAAKLTRQSILVNAVEQASATANRTGDLFIKQKALLWMQGQQITSGGPETTNPDWTELDNDSAGLSAYRLVTQGGFYNGDWTSGIACNSHSFIVGVQAEELPTVFDTLLRSGTLVPAAAQVHGVVPRYIPWG